MTATRSIHCLLLIVFCHVLSPLAAQEQSVRPGINKSYVDPDVDKAIERFERENREIFRQREKILAACQLRPGMDVADVGAGTGLFTRLIAAQVGPKGKVYAVDIAKSFIQHIEKTCREQKLDNVVGVVCTATSAELPPASVDLVFTCDTYHHLEYPFKTLASIRQALRPGGRLLIVDYRKDPDSSKWTQDHVRADKATVIDEVTRSGFKFVDEPEVAKEQYMLRFERTP